MLPYKDSDSVYMSYDGPFHIEIIADLANSTINYIIASEFVRKKLYRIFIELTQNVAFYSLNQILNSKGSTIGKGIVIISHVDNGFQCTTINKIKKEHATVLFNNCRDINRASIEELRDKKMKLREMSNFLDQGAHIGIIMIRIYSGNLLEFEVINDIHSEDTYFKISATITKTIVS